jgi:hypothetical protein
VDVNLVELGNRSGECDGEELGNGDVDEDGITNLSFSGLYGESDEANTDESR